MLIMCSSPRATGPNREACTHTAASVMVIPEIDFGCGILNAASELGDQNQSKVKECIPLAISLEGDG